MTTNLVIIALIAYLLGSIPFGYILVKLFLKQDIRATGSGNIGATNVARSGNKGLAIATLLLDAGKGALAVLIAQHLNPCEFITCVPGVEDKFFLNSPLMPAVAALAVILGHVFPFWLKFRGGKGVATAIGAFAILSPWAALGSFICFSVVLVATRFVSLSSVLGASAFPFLVYGFAYEGRNSFLLAVTAAASILIILKHQANIRRLIAGTEPKFGVKVFSPDPIQTEKNI